MNLKEQLAAKKAELVALKDGIEAGDKEAIQKADEVSAAIEELNNTIASAQKAQDMLNTIGSKEQADEANEEEPKMNENTGLKSLDLASLKSNRGAVSTEIKAATDTVMGTQVADVDKNVVDVKPESGVRALFGAESISGNALTYFVMTATEGASGVVAEGAKKHQIHPKYEVKTAALTKIAAFLKETDELLNDTPYLESAVRGRGVYAHDQAVDAYLVDALTKTSGIQSLAEAISFDALLKAKTKVKTATGYEADAIVINPADLQTLLLTKDGANGTVGQYLMGGPAYAPYGNGAYGAYLPIWGMKVVSSSAIASGTAIVGAFKAGASVVSKSGEGFRVEVSNSDEDDFQNNMVTVRLEERILEAVRVPAAFVKIATA